MPDGAGIGNLRQLSGAASARQQYTIVVSGASGASARQQYAIVVPGASGASACQQYTIVVPGASGGRELSGALYVASRQDLRRRFAHDRRHRQQTSQKVKHQNQQECDSGSQGTDRIQAFII